MCLYFNLYVPLSFEHLQVLVMDNVNALFFLLRNDTAKLVYEEYRIATAQAGLIMVGCANFLTIIFLGLYEEPLEVSIWTEGLLLSCFSMTGNCVHPVVTSVTSVMRHTSCLRRVLVLLTPCSCSAYTVFLFCVPEGSAAGIAVLS